MTLCFKGREKWRLVSLALSPGMASGGGVREVFEEDWKEPFVFIWESFPFPSLLTYPMQHSDPLWQTWPSERNVVCFSVIEVACNFAMCFT